MRQIIIFKNDIIKYPPILSIVNILSTRGDEVQIFAYCSNENKKKEFQDKGIKFNEVISESISTFFLRKLALFYRFRKQITRWLELNNRNDTQLWLFGTQTMYILNGLLKRYNCILYFFELPPFEVPKKYLIFCRNSNFKKLLGIHKNKVVCCEYNRAHITKAYFHLPKLPYVVPNKPFVDESIYDSIKWEKSWPGKKVILYQGIFNYPERKLDGLCEAVELLSDEYILVLMGGDNNYKNSLKRKYMTEKIVFLPFRPFPYYFEITQQAHIGVLCYYPDDLSSISNMLNVLYCAPNKIYEYSRYGIPMISNDIPALKQTFEHWQCGVVTDMLEPRKIVDALNMIEEDYHKYKSGAKRFYNSNNIQSDILMVADAR